VHQWPPTLMHTKGSKPDCLPGNGLFLLPDPAPSTDSDNVKQILLQCVKDAAEVIRDSGIQLGNSELEKLAATLFITRAKNA
jgi:hypothetical protein